jgi:4-amino-4-deoxy-L-arabinose transferase
VTTNRRDAGAFALAAAAFCTGLGAYGLVETSDARYAEIAREMAASGDWIYPRLLGILHFDKPPLIYWLSGLGYSAFGFDEWGARACLAVLALLLCARLWSFARTHLGDRTAPWTVALLAGTPAIVGASRMLTTDLLLCVCLTFALTGWYDVWSGRGGLGARLSLYAGAGLAFLAKGPVGWLVLALIVGPFAMRRRGAHPRPKRSWGAAWGLPMLLLIAAPWYLAVISGTPGLFSYFTGQQLASRLHEGGLGHPHPWYYYAGVFPLLGLPWLLLAPAGWKDVRSENAPLASFLLWWMLLPPLFFSLPSTKLPLYVLPAFPGLALLAGHAVAAGRGRRELRLAAALLVIVGIGLGALAVVGPSLPGGDLVDVPAARLLGILLPPGLLLVAAGGLAVFRSRGRDGAASVRRAAVPVAVGMALLAPLVLLHGDALPLKTTRPVGRVAAALIRVRPGAELVEYRDLAAGLPLYTGRLPLLAGIEADTRFEPPSGPARTMERGQFLRDLWAGPDPVFVVTRPRHAADLPGAREVARGGGYVLVSNR